MLIIGRRGELAIYRAEMLNRAGFEARIPDTTEDAVRIIESGDFDVEVLSYTLPGDLVQELAERLRQSRPEGAIVAIADTNRIDRRISPDAVALAEHGPAGLLSAVQQVLRRR